MNWNDIKNTILTFLKTTGWALVKSLLIFVVGVFAVKMIVKLLNKILKKTKLEAITRSFVISISKFVLYMLLMLIVLSSLGVEITGLIALLTTASLAVGLALQDSLSNLANGIIIITTKPFAKGDYVLINGVEGTIKHIKMLNTTITTVDGKIVILPNSSIVTSNIVNYNTTGKRRIDLFFDVAYESDIKKVNEIILQVMNSNGKTDKDPAPFVSLKQMDSSSLKIFANCWVDSEDYWDVYYYILNNVFNEFKRNDISVPYNQMEVRVRDDKVTMPFEKEKLQERVEKVRKEKEDTDNIFVKMQKSITEKKKSKKRKNKNKIEKEEVKQTEFEEESTNDNKEN